MLLAPVMPKPRRSTMALSVELLVFSRWMPACVDSRSCMVRALLAAISSAVITETATGRVAASEGTRCAVTMTGLSSVGAGVCWAAARAGAEQSRTPALRRGTGFHLHDLEATRDPAGHSRWEDAASGGPGRGVLTVEQAGIGLPCGWRMGTVAGAAQAGLGRRA